MDDKQKVYEFLRSHPIGVLATVGSGHIPHATAIYFVVEEDLSVKFLSKRDTKKIENIKNNSKVMLEVFEAATQTNVQIAGVAEDISDEMQAHDVFTKVLEVTRATSQADVPPVSKLLAGNYVAYRVNPSQIRYRVYQPLPSPSSETEFITIDF